MEVTAMDLPIGQLETILDSLPSSVVIFNAADHKFTYVNRRGQELYGSSYTGLTLEAHFALIKVLKPDGTPLPFEEMPICRSMQFGEVIRNQEMIFVNSQGRSIPVLVSSAPLYDAQGQITAALVIFDDVTDCKRAEQVWQASEARQKFLLQLNDWLRTANDPLEIQAGVSRMLGEHLGADRAFFADLRDESIALIWIDYFRPGLASLAGRYSLADFFNDAVLHSSQPLIIPDTAHTPLLAEHARNAFGALGMRALVGTTLLKEGQLAHALYVACSTPRDWTADEADLIREVGERTWEALVRVRATNALQASEERYRQIVTTANEGIAVCDSEGRVTFVNEIMTTWLGYEVEEMLGRSVDDFIQEEDIHKIAAYFTKLKAGTNERFELRGRRKDGGCIWVLVSASSLMDQGGNFVGFLGMFSDINGLKELEDKLGWRAQMLANVHDAIIAVDANNTVIYCNKAVETLFGWSKEELVGQWYSEIGQNYFLVAAVERELWPTQLRSPDKDQHHAIKCFHKNGTSFFADANSTVLQDKQGAYAGTIFSIRDISQHVMAIQQLQQSEHKAQCLIEKLRQADQNKNKYINTLSHELRNPLASIMMCLSLQQQVPLGSDEDRQARAVIERQAVQLSRLVDDLLEVARISQNKTRLQKERVELNRLVQQVVADYQAQFAAQEVALAAELTPDPLYLEADPARLTQVLGNLLHNAAKFTKPGDKTLVTITADETTRSATIRVKDTGRGIQPEMLPKLFQAFVQADNSLASNGGGLGLGLSIVKGMVELHSGSVAAHSDGLGRGTQFTITLPLPAAASNKPEQPAQDCGSPARSLRVLIIDDIPDIAEILAGLLSNLGHQVITAYSGPEGLAKAKEFHPEVLLCDIGLPQMNGYEVAECLRKDHELQGIYPIALSGYAQPDDLERARTAGFKRHLAKPVDLDTLKVALEEVS